MDFSTSTFLYSSKIVKFHNYIEIVDKKTIIKYSKLTIKKLQILQEIPFDDIQEKFLSIRSTEQIDSLANLEYFVIAMKKYGFSERYVIKDMLLGNNLRDIEYINSRGQKDVIPAFVIDPKKAMLIKMPISVDGDRNRIRLIVLVQKTFQKTNIYPLFFDFNHFLYSASNYNDVNKNNFFESIFFNCIKNHFGD